MGRPRQLPQRPDLTAGEIDAAHYVGSGEHKTTRWQGGLPEAYVGSDGRATRPGRQDTTVCPLVSETDRERASEWVRTALGQRRYRYYEGDKTCPKHIWHRDDGGAYWFGFCVNGIAGSYKGWPIDEAEKRATFG